jgi:hypothetical protein
MLRGYGSFSQSKPLFRSFELAGLKASNVGKWLPVVGSFRRRTIVERAFDGRPLSNAAWFRAQAEGSLLQIVRRPSE